MNRIVKLVTALVAPLVLTGCFLLPGKFDATLKLLKGGQYEFSYVGEMQVFAGDDKDMEKPELKPFDPEKARCSDWVEADGSRSPSSYYDSFSDSEEAVADAEEATEAGSFPKREKRSCTDTELAELEEQEKALYERRKTDYEQRSNMMAAMFGGAVPGNDEALKKFAVTLRKYDGWEKVEYAGDNIFNVEYRVSGNFDRYFGFPIINDSATQYPFFQIVPRKSGELELQAPGLGGQGGIMGMAMLGGFPGAGSSKEVPIKPIEGSFTLETNGEVLGNNSPDGYSTEGELKIMRWDVKNLTESPRALVKIN